MPRLSCRQNKGTKFVCDLIPGHGGLESLFHDLKSNCMSIISIRTESGRLSVGSRSFDGLDRAFAVKDLSDGWFVSTQVLQVA
jgi:hypothetical protein